MTKVDKIGLRKRLALRLFAGIRHELAEKHELREIFWESTLRCNLSCRHCGSDCRSSSAVPDMPAADFLAAVDKITPHVCVGATWKMSAENYISEAIRGVL